MICIKNGDNLAFDTSVVQIKCYADIVCLIRCNRCCFFEDEEGLPRIENIESDDEYEAAADRFDELLDDEMFDDI